MPVLVAVVAHAEGPAERFSAGPTPRLRVERDAAGQSNTPPPQGKGGGCVNALVEEGRGISCRRSRVGSVLLGVSPHGEQGWPPGQVERSSWGESVAVVERGVTFLCCFEIGRTAVPIEFTQVGMQ